MKVYVIYPVNGKSSFLNKRLTFSKEEAENSVNFFWNYEEIEIDEHTIPTENLEIFQEILTKRLNEK